MRLIARLIAIVACCVATYGAELNATPLTTTVPNSLLRTTRTLLTGSLTYYVNNSTGSDSNNGLTSGTPFLTIQHAVNLISNTLDLGGNSVTIQLTAGQTYGISVAVNPFVGYGAVILDGATTASIITSDSTIATEGGGGSAPFIIQNITVGCYGAGCIEVFAQTPGYLIVGVGVTFNSCGSGQAQMGAAAPGALVQFLYDYTIAGGCALHILSSNLGLVVQGVTPLTVTLTGTPHFSSAFVECIDTANVFIVHTLVTYSGAATGPKFYVGQGGVIDTVGGGVNYFPGSSPGTAAAYSPYN